MYSVVKRYTILHGGIKFKERSEHDERDDTYKKQFQVRGQGTYKKSCYRENKQAGEPSGEEGRLIKPGADKGGEVDAESGYILPVIH